MEPRHSKRWLAPLALALAAAMVVGLIGPATAHRPRKFWEYEPRIKKHKTWRKHKALRRLHARWHEQHTQTVYEECGSDPVPGDLETQHADSGEEHPMESEEGGGASEEQAATEEDAPVACEQTPLTTTSYTARQHRAYHHRLHHRHLRRHHRNRILSREKGKASWYDYEGRIGACGKPLRGMYAAHKTLPCGSLVAVRRGGKVVRVRIKDRGPFVRGWIIDLAPRAFKKLGGLGEGVIPVKIYHLKKR